MENSKKKNKTMVWIIIAVILAAVAGIVGFNQYKEKKMTEEISRYVQNIESDSKKFGGETDRTEKLELLKQEINLYDTYIKEQGKETQEEILTKYEKTIEDMKKYFKDDYAAAIETATIKELDTVKDKEQLNELKANLEELRKTIQEEQTSVLTKKETEDFEKEIAALEKSYEDRMKVIEEEEKAAEEARKAEEEAKKAEEEKKKAEEVVAAEQAKAAENKNAGANIGAAYGGSSGNAAGGNSSSSNGGNSNPTPAPEQNSGGSDVYLKETYNYTTESGTSTTETYSDGTIKHTDVNGNTYDITNNPDIF